MILKLSLILQPGIQSDENLTKQWKFIARFFSNLRKDCPILGILVIGETGTGKSTLINNLLGRVVAAVGDTMTPGTLDVIPHELSVEGVPVVVYDTPGLDDARIDENEEEKYLEIMKSLLARKKIHLVIYCFKMTENRIRRSLVRTFKEYHKIDVPWEQSIIALTFSDMQEDTSKLFLMQDELKKTLIRQVGVLPSAVERLKICPTAKNPNEDLPNGSPWYVPFWLDVIEVLVPAALLQFLYIHSSNIHVEGMPAAASNTPGVVNVALTGEDKNRFEKQVAKLKSGEDETDIEVIGFIKYLQEFSLLHK